MTNQLGKANRWVTNRDCEIVEKSGQESKLIPNSPILGNKHELKGIGVNKGQIHGELG